MNGVIRLGPYRESVFQNLGDFYSLCRSTDDACCPPEQAGAKWTPDVDITENDDQFTIRAGLAGIKKEDVKVQIQDRMVTISGECKFSQEDKTIHRIERCYGSFSRSFSLPKNVDASKIRAESQDGILSVSLPKVREAEPKTIEVKVD